MTLIIGYAAPEFVMVASDRMATWSWIDNAKPKALRVTQQYVPQITKTIAAGGTLWAFSGVADLGASDKDTSEWLVRKLQQVESDPAISARPDEFVREALSRELDRLSSLPARTRRSGRLLWFSLMIVGFAQISRDPDVPLLLDGEPVLAQDTGQALGVVIDAQPMMWILSNAKNQELGQGG